MEVDLAHVLRPSELGQSMQIDVRVLGQDRKACPFERGKSRINFAWSYDEIQVANDTRAASTASRKASPPLYDERL
jgi:hypothetical protein